jgi:hypothetical protein
MSPSGRRATTIRPADKQSPVWAAHLKPVFSRTPSAANAQAVQVSAMSEPACRPPHSRPACSRSRFEPVSQSANRADQETGPGPSGPARGTRRAAEPDCSGALRAPAQFLPREAKATLLASEPQARHTARRVGQLPVAAPTGVDRSACALVYRSLGQCVGLPPSVGGQAALRYARRFSGRRAPGQPGTWGHCSRYIDTVIITF